MTTDEDKKLAAEIVALVLRDEEAAWGAVAALLATYREHHHHEGEIAEIRRAGAEHDALADLARRLRALRNDRGRIDLTDSSKRQDVYELVRRAEGIGPT
jgi:ATP-dependent exoDNAse (exonuclease V) beta subunit